MGMQENVFSGYILPAKDLSDLWGGELREKFNLLVEDTDVESLSDFLTDHLPTEFPPFSNVYMPGDEDTVDGEEMRKGEMYVIFDDEDLYVLTKTPALQTMESVLGKIPQRSQWSVWG